MGRWIDPSWWTHWAISCSSQCSTTGNKGCGMCYPVCGMMHIKELMLLIRKSSLCGGSGFPLSLSVWSFTICMTPYNHKYNVLSASLNKTFTSFLNLLVPCQLNVQLIAILEVFINLKFTNTLPNSVKAGYLNIPVVPYIPSPLRCFKKFARNLRDCFVLYVI